MTLQAGSKAPDLTLQFLPSEASRLAEYELENLAEGPGFLIFAKSSCPTCQWCLPILDRLHRNYGQAGAYVVLVLQETIEDAVAFARQEGIQMPIAIDSPPYPASDAYQVNFVPTSYWIDAAGQIGSVVESFHRTAFEEVNQRLARAAEVEVQPLFLETEAIPLFRPG